MANDGGFFGFWSVAEVQGMSSVVTVAVRVGFYVVTQDFYLAIHIYSVILVPHSVAASSDCPCLPGGKPTGTWILR